MSIMPPVHPGKILAEEYLAPMRVTAGALAKKLGVPRTRVERIVAGATPISTETALRLAKYFGTSPEFWLNMQTSYDLKIMAPKVERELAKIKAISEHDLQSAA